MKKITILTIAMPLIWCSCDKTNKKDMAITYPEIKKTDTTDVYFNTEIKDPYRWLEDDRSEETTQWVKAENKVTFDYLEQIPFRQQLKKRLENLWNYEKLSSPFKEGDYTYYFKNDGLQDQSVLYRKNDEGEEEIFLDPNTFSEDGTISLGGVHFTRDGSLAAYSISEGGSDWRKVIVMDAASKEIIEDTLTDIKFSGVSWKGREGFYYSSYDKPEGSELSAKTDQHKLYYHKLGTPQNEDLLIFGGTPEQKHRYVGGGVTEDERYLVISAANSTSGSKLFIQDLQAPESGLIPVVNHEDSDSYILDNKGSTLYIATNLDAPNQKVVTTDASDPTPENWKDLIPETENVLSISTGGGFLFTKYMIDAVSKVYQYDYEGNKIREIELPGIGTASGFGGKEEQKTLYYSFTNYNTPAHIYSYDVDSGDSKLYWKPDIDFNPDDYISEQVFYNSKDGTRVPMIITYKKGTELNGKNPTILYGYGGFNISLQPSFSTTNAIWLEQGGIYAVPNLRGGGEYGKKWHIAGTKLQKQNVFDDFIAAAEYLIDNKYTSSEYLAIRGGSNGGLLVGATMTQRPDLMQVALPAVGVLDMLRYHKFTAGAGWAYDYGTSEDSEGMFKYLLGYSPLHNVKENTEYPATLISTADHDDRVVPAHSFKFAATLQEKQTGNNPVLIRIETDAGHGAGTPISKTIEQTADIFGFTLYQMGYKELPNPEVEKEEVTP
ncbi:prolyl oligopeptidase family serine peptidase [Sinomicrobium weinanense]|uniref:prolyl oligopeptidase n=1 Tax=Sinomicrobium weinanense TaxID=2842200 RepID=A0A926JST8_9FLAO|nr:prolyl oligopeptidase family serine peptidase [Sinomicrobium weinanense]MBC9796877.1 S9 family peptidase [Sinomicrobium weinanense]MBU3123872.1 prolyl oligopeptidase family serine peptidase [Sinomicrobium weinanense]